VTSAKAKANAVSNVGSNNKGKARKW